MKLPHLAVALAALAWAAPTTHAQKLVNLPVGTWANDVTPDTKAKDEEKAAEEKKKPAI